LIRCRQYGALTVDLVSVLLRAEPGARPSAAQVLAIPAVRPYADAYVRRMRDSAVERCTSPPLQSTGNDVVTPEPQRSSDAARCCGRLRPHGHYV